MLNPGTNVPQCYENAADVIVTFEGSYQSYIDDPAAPNPYTPLTWTPTDPMKIWHIVYGAPDTASMEQAVALSKTRDAGYVYVTDDVLANPYDTLPPADYWAAELASTAGSARDRPDPRTAAWPRHGGGVRHQSGSRLGGLAWPHARPPPTTSTETAC